MLRRVTVALVTTLILASSASSAPAPADASALLAAAKAEMAPLPEQLMTTTKDQLTAQVIILEARADPRSAAAQARQLKSAFYASLALGGVAAAQLPKDPEAAEALYREAVEQSLTITHWTGNHPTSLTFPFGLIERFPKEQARKLLAWSRERFLAEEPGDELVRSYPMLALARATVAVEPAAVRETLTAAMKSYHYWEAQEYLGTILAESDLPGALEFVKGVKHTPQYALRSVYFVQARKDLNTALEGIWRMPYPDNEVAAVHLAKRFLESGQRQEAKKVVADMETARNPRMEVEWIRTTLKQIREQLDAKSQPEKPSTTVGPTEVESFIANPDAKALERFSTRHTIIFRDKAQAARFVTAAWPVVDGFGLVMSDPYPDIFRQYAYGLLMSCAAVAGDTEKALQIARKVVTRELRAGFLLEAYAVLVPLPAPVADWPIHFVEPSKVSLQN